MALEFLSGFVDFFLDPILNLPPLLAILVISFLISLMITLIYKFTTDQKLMKDLKDEIKEFQTQLKTLKEDPEKMMEVQKRAMEVNMKYMMHSFRPTLFTFIPIILIFGWLQANFAFAPIAIGDEFDVQATFDDVAGSVALEVKEGLKLLDTPTMPIKKDLATWSLEATKAGEHSIALNYKNITITKDIIVTSNQQYVNPIKKVDIDGLKEISVAHEKLIVLDLFGWEIGWLGTYIIFSIFFSMTLRKILKIY